MSSHVRWFIVRWPWCIISKLKIHSNLKMSLVTCSIFLWPSLFRPMKLQYLPICSENHTRKVTVKIRVKIDLNSLYMGIVEPCHKFGLRFNYKIIESDIINSMRQITAICCTIYGVHYSYQYKVYFHLLRYLNIVGTLSIEKIQRFQNKIDSLKIRNSICDTIKLHSIF